MKKEIILCSLIISLLLCGCLGSGYNPGSIDKSKSPNSIQLEVQTACNDGVICYLTSDSNTFAGSPLWCTQNQTLVEKYCGG